MAIDCAELRFIDSSGLNALVRTARQLRDDNRDLALFHVDDNLRKLLKITALDALFVIE